MNTLEAIDRFKALLTSMLLDDRQKHSPALIEALGAPTVEIEASTKFARVVTGDKSSRSAYAFIALEDGENKSLGAFKAGQIFKPASWKAPARHARGSVFDADPLKCCGPYGVAYLR